MPKTAIQTTVIVPTRVDAAEFWSAIMGSAWESWSWWRKVQYLDGADWDKPGQVKITMENPSGDLPMTETLELQDLVAAYTKALKAGDLRDDWDNLDAGSGDVVMQYALYGEIVYC
jgi:hypothetical protein